MVLPVNQCYVVPTQNIIFIKARYVADSFNGVVSGKLVKPILEILDKKEPLVKEFYDRVMGEPKMLQVISLIDEDWDDLIEKIEKNKSELIKI